MSEIVLIDTSVFLNMLDVPGFNQHRGQTFTELERLLGANASLLLPVAAIVETGNHIAQLADGNQRRAFAIKFCEQVHAAIAGTAPWRAMRVPDTLSLAGWLAEFPDHAMRGVGIGDLSIIRDWQATCERHAGYRVRVWSLDHGLEHCDRAALI